MRGSGEINENAKVEEVKSFVICRQPLNAAQRSFRICGRAEAESSGLVQQQTFAHQQLRRVRALKKSK